MMESITSQFTPIDWIFLVWMSFSILLGLIRGFIAEVLSLIGWVLAFALAQHYALEAAAKLPLPPQIKEGAPAFLAGFLLVFLGTLLIWTMVRTLLRFAVGKGCFDYLLGFIFGAARGYVVAMLVISVIGMVLPLPNMVWWQKAYFHHFLDQGATQVRAILPAQWSKKIQLKAEDLPQKIGTAIANSTPSQSSTLLNALGANPSSSPSVLPSSTINNGALPSLNPSLAPPQFAVTPSRMPVAPLPANPALPSLR